MLLTGTMRVGLRVRVSLGSPPGWVTECGPPPRTREQLSPDEEEFESMTSGCTGYPVPHHGGEKPRDPPSALGRQGRPGPLSGPFSRPQGVAAGGWGSQPTRGVSLSLSRPFPAPPWSVTIGLGAGRGVKREERFGVLEGLKLRELASPRRPPPPAARPLQPISGARRISTSDSARARV